MSLSKFNFKVYGIKSVRISKKQDRKKQRQDLLQKALPPGLDLEQKSGKKRKMSASKVLNLCSELNLKTKTTMSMHGQDLDQGMGIILCFISRIIKKKSENDINYKKYFRRISNILSNYFSQLVILSILKIH